MRFQICDFTFAMWLFMNTKTQLVCHWSALRCHTAAHLTANLTSFPFFASKLSPHGSTELSSNAVILPGLQMSWTTVSKTKDEWTLAIQRGRRVLAVRHIPVVWLVMCAKPGRLLASLASPPLVSSWWMAVVLATPPVVTTGTARSRVLPLVPTELRTGPWDLVQTTWGWRRRKICTHRHVQENFTFHAHQTTIMT